MWTNIPAYVECSEMDQTRAGCLRRLTCLARLFFSFPLRVFEACDGMQRGALYSKRGCYFRGLYSMVDVPVEARLLHLVVFCLCPVDEGCWLLVNVDICFQAGRWAL